MGYPGTFDTFTTKNAGDTIAQSHVNDLQTAVVSLEHKLGSSSTGLAASTNTALLGSGASATGFQVISLANTSLITGTLGLTRGGTGGATAAAAWTNIGAVGDAVAKNDNTAYQAATDGFFTCLMIAGASSSAGRVIGYSDSNNPPTTTVTACHVWVNTAGHAESAYSNIASFCIPIKKSNYYMGVKASTGNAPTVTYSFIPIGN